MQHKTSSDDDIQSLRRAIDGIDRTLVDLLNKRFDLSIAIGREKKKGEKVIQDKGREEAILKKVRELSPVHGDVIVQLYKKLFELSRQVQE